MFGFTNDDNDGPPAKSAIVIIIIKQFRNHDKEYNICVLGLLFGYYF